MIDASVALSQAELLVDKIDNYHWKGLLYLRLGIVSDETCGFKLSMDYGKKAEDYFGLAGSESYRLYSMLNIGYAAMMMKDFSSADSIFQIAERASFALGDSSLQYRCFLSRLSCFSYMHEPDLATELIDRNGILIDESNRNLRSLVTMSRYYTEREDYAKAESLLNRAEQLVKTEDDTLSYYFNSFWLAYKKGEIDKAFYYYTEYSSILNTCLRTYLNQPLLEAQYNNYRAMAELERLKVRDKITMLVTTIILILLISLIVLLTLLNKKRQTEERIREYISSINDLTTQISVNKDKISKLNDKVREMLRQEFNPSDYLYTRYYEQIDDSKKAERLFKVVKTQVEGFTNRKNIDHIDELLNETFDGIMNKVLSSGIDIKEKDLLLLRFVLAGFSSKSIAALLGETHLNVNQRKKRLLDKIQIKDPKLMSELSNALNNK